MQKRPNILIILTDQHNPHTAGYAGDKYARTGTLDRLAAEATRFSAAYCQSPLCVPSRISMLTGRYTFECSAWDNSSLLDDEHLTFAEHLSDNGYTTCCVGKMHLCGERWMGGFDHRPFGDLRCMRFPFHQPDPPETWDGRWNRHSVGRFPWAGKTRLPESMLVDDMVTREALAFLREHHDSSPDQPWLMVAGYSRPHFPLTAPGRYVRRALADRVPLAPLPAGYPETLHPHERNIVEDFKLTSFSAEEQQHALACYYACLDYVDDCIGELLNGLRRDGLLDNTYIIYTSDHGDMAGEHGLWWKRTYYDASAGVPLMIAGPGVEVDQSCDIPVELVDLYPTLCDMAGVDIPEGVRGESLMPLCYGRSDDRVKRHARCDFSQGNGMNPWMFRMIRSADWKLVEFAAPDAPPVLFDMNADPGETQNVLAAGETQQVSEEIEQLQQILHEAPDWESTVARRTDDRERWAREKKRDMPLSAPAQFMLDDGRIVDADRVFYPGL